MQDFSQFLQWLIFGGGAVMASSFLLERLPAFQKLTAETKKFVSYVASSALGIGAYALVTFAPDFVVTAQPYFFILSATFISIYLNNMFHKADKEHPKG